MSKIQFIEATHQYLTEEKEELKSVSKFTEQFKEKVNWGEIAKRKAIKLTKEGTITSSEDILAKWNLKGTITRSIGTLLHKDEEEALINTEAPEFYGTKCEKKISEYQGECKYSIPINTLQNNTVYPELMIYDLDYMICGQSDKVIVVNNKINIWDYKTDQEISFQAFSNKWVKPRKLLPPLSHLDDCNGNIYSIKMSLYMYMLWKANKGKFKPGEIVIEHKNLLRDVEMDNIPILENGKPIITKTEQIRLPYRKSEVQAMLKTVKTNI